MSPGSSDRPVREVYLAALDIADDARRREFLDEACGVDTERRREVEEFLGVHAEGISSPLDEMVNRFGNTDSMDAADTLVDAAEPPMIGPYKIREQIGEGGFGVVYVAEQTEPVQRKVALKIIKPGMDSKEVIGRFQAERQALAMMDHPNIAKVLDAGTTENGRPYFVMELIHGKPITKFCREKKLDLSSRLKLLIDVCKAVQHAHQKGIIHRDLKPSNVMITLHDDTPVVKVIDFGVAKALSQKLTPETVYTRHTQMIGTPAYMSPEQAELSGLDVDTRTDIYSLGVLLYELLTGVTPFDQHVLIAKGFDEMRRIIREDDPPRPSLRAETLGAETVSTEQNGKAPPNRKFSRLQKRELDWIVMKALEKDRERRYESANALAEDLERYLANEPVQACPPSLAYRVKKFTGRHKKLINGLVFVMVVLGIAVGAEKWRTNENPWVFDPSTDSSKWYDLISRPPRLLAEAPSEPDNVWGHKEGQFIFSMTAGPQFLSLGENQHSSFRIHAEMKKQNLDGTTGIFFGGEQDDEGRLVSCQAIVFEKTSAGKLQAFRRIYRFYQPGSYPGKIDKLHCEREIDFDLRSRLRLEIAVRANRVSGVKLNGDSLVELFDRNTDWGDDAPSVKGPFGLVNHGGAALVPVFHFKPSAGE